MNRDNPIQFGRVPTAVIATGVLVRLNVAETRLYLAICGYSGGSEWTASVSVERLAQLVGKCSRTVRRVTNQLVAKGLIKVSYGGGRSSLNRYTVVTNPDTMDVPLSEPKPGRPECPPLGDKPGHFDNETRTLSALNPDTQDVRRSEDQSIQSTGALRFPLRGGGEWSLPDARLAEYRAAFPELDTLAEVRKARLWLIDSPGKRKTASGMPRFLSNWLGRAGDAGFKSDKTPTSVLDTICPLVGPSEEDMAELRAMGATKP